MTNDMGVASSQMPASKTPNGLYRIKPDPHGKGGRWKVLISRSGFRFASSFADSRFGSSKRSKAAATELLKKVIKVLPPRFNTPKSFKPGRGVIRSKYKRYVFWIAHAYAKGVSKSRSFSIRKYGDKKAHRLALKAREELLLTVGRNPKDLKYPDKATLEAIQSEVLRKFLPRKRKPKPHPGFKDEDLYGIQRIEGRMDGTLDCWAVQIKRKGKTIKRNFGDKEFGGKRKALAVARRWRDQKIAKHKPMTKEEYRSLIRVNNTSGHAGVYRGICHKHPYWIAGLHTGRRYITRCFSINKYGEDEARELAIDARETLLAEHAHGYHLMGSEAARQHVEMVIEQGNKKQKHN